MPESFADVKARKGYVRIRGQESRTSLNKVSILARKLTSVYARITTKMEFRAGSPSAQCRFDPVLRQHELYQPSVKYYSETLGQSASVYHPSGKWGQGQNF